METVMSNAKTAISFFKTLDTKNVEDVSSFWAPGYQGYFPSASPGIDRSMHKGMIKMFETAFPDYSHEVDDVVESENKVVLRGTFSGTHKGDFNGIPATNKPVTIGWIDISEFDNDGKILNEWLELDMVGMMKQMGVLPE
jgi:predicted ester cyclase